VASNDCKQRQSSAEYEGNIAEDLMKRLLAALLAWSLLVFSPSAIAQKPNPPGTAKATQNPARGNPAAKVWANAVSRTYHCPGTRYYGKTKRGTFMTQQEAMEKGYRPARGKFCR
jgi:hypothetical protein